MLELVLFNSDLEEGDSVVLVTFAALSIQGGLQKRRI